MNNNLYRLEKDLKSIAKKYKSVKYSLGLAILFLMLGWSAFSEESATPSRGEIEVSKELLRNSIGDLQSKIENARIENKKQLKGARLELIQLMEQGNQVVKSPWSSWQFGINYFYNDWQGGYKGRGDKEANKIFQRDVTIARFQENNIQAKYNTTNLKIVEEPKAVITLGAGIRPKSINKQSPNLQLPTVNPPASPALNIDIKSPEAIVTPSVDSPTVSLPSLDPNANPFSDFGYKWIYGWPSKYATANVTDDTTKTGTEPLIQNYDITAGTLWTGVNTNGEVGNYSGATNITYQSKYMPAPQTINIGESNQRRLSAINLSYGYDKSNTAVAPALLGTAKISGITVFVAGSDTPVVGIGGSYTGSEAIHLVGLADIKDSTFNLYGKAAVVNMESWRSPKLKISNSTINVNGDNNTLFNIQAGSYSYENGWNTTSYSGPTYTGSIEGDVDINLNTKNNSIYAIAGYTRSFKIENKGTIKSSGASNIIVSDLGYVADSSKYIGTGVDNAPAQHETNKDNYIPSILLTTPVEQYGDENVTLFFNTKRGGGSNSPLIGIYQGEINVNAKIGEYLSSDALAKTQTVNGQINKTGYTDKTVDSNVGVYAISGQRTDLIPTRDLSANKFNDKDKIHNLEIGKFDIKFGKYSKNGIMFLSKKGTVIDVGKASSTKHIGGVTTDFSDGINDATTQEADASTRTIIAYSEGVWKGTEHKITKASTLEDKPSEINLYSALTMASKNGIAYFGENKGIVNAKSVTDTVAVGHNSIIAYAKNEGTVNITAGIRATDDNVTTLTEKYKNIGAYTKSGSGTGDTTITINGNTTINGLGALAEGTNTKIYLKGTNNTINTGTEGALFAKDGGIIEFGGGTINNKDNSAARGLSDNDHKNVTPFYVPDSSQIKFNGTTQINMYDGVLVFGEDSDYSATIDNASKYQGMNKIDVKLMNNGVNLGVFKRLNNVTWNGNSGANTYVNFLKTIPKFNSIDTNDKSFKSTLTEGSLIINSDVNLSDTNDGYNNISMERELVTINAGKKVTGNGKGLSMGSNSGATSNTESGYINKGAVEISGGTATTGVAGINVSYGQILNDTTGTVQIDNGAGLYGTNGSKIVNKGTVTVTGSGTGIAGLGKGNTTPAITYGDGKVEIVNDGIINIAGANSTGIYAENNNGAAQSDVTITNNKSLTLGNSGVGIALKSGSVVGGIINVSGTGSSDIKVGANGFGIYAEDSKVTLNTDYGIETGDNGVGIYTKGNSTVGNSKTLNYKYSGSTSGSGIATLYSGVNATNNLNINLNNSTNTTGGVVGAYADGGGNFTNTGNITGTSNAAEFGIVVDKNTNVVNSGNITLGNANSLSKGNVGIYVKTSPNTITNSGNITVGNNSIALYGYGVTHTNGNITAGDNSIGIYSQGGNISLTGGTLVVGRNEAVGVFTSGANQTITGTNAMTIGDTSYGYVIKGAGHNLTTNNAGGVTLGNDSVYAYSDKSGTMTNYTALTSTGSRNYGLYSAGDIKNLADINFGSGVGNVGVYSIGATATNGDTVLGISPRITVSGSDIINEIYGIGMAAGYTDNKGVTHQTGHIINNGTIKVEKEDSMGMYATGSGSLAENYGTIELSGKNTTGMYLDNNAIGINHKGATITTVPNSTNDGIKGVVATNGAILKNYGTINIKDGTNLTGVYLVGGQYDTSSTGSVVGGIVPRAQSDTSKKVGEINIKAPGDGTATITRNDKLVTPTLVDTNIATPTPTYVTVGKTTLDISASVPKIRNMGKVSEIGMYVDTSGVNYTNPIQGLQYLTGLEKVNLIFGNEATKYTTSKEIKIGENILKPYNDIISQVNQTSSKEVRWELGAGSLTWIATGTQGSNDTFNAVYLVKIPYTEYAREKDTYNFLDGLEQRYGVEGMDSKEKDLFDKLNSIGKGEPHLFAQAIDEMKGHQYANVQQRVYTTGQLLDKEFDYLRNEWRTASKDSNKIKIFGARGEYKTDTAGIIDYKYNAYGVAYVHENEDIKLGKGIGWYTGIVHNTFKFKDIGNSKEKMLEGKIGLFKSIPFDDNNSLNWTISGDVFVGYNKMYRKYLVIDEIFNAKSKYYTYGVGIKNEIGKEFRLSEDFSLRPYGSLKLEYGRMSKIKEKSGEIRLEVKDNDYVSIKPEIGAELVFKHFFSDYKILKIGLGVAYENELGRVSNPKNKVRVAYTTADWYNLRGEREDRKGNIKTDLNIGIDNTRIGITANVGYDTKGHNVKGGLGLRVIF
ncbi:autotransporter-associated N-terminal domain-containing protein [Fusobacterium simiae]|uniref:Autotransporter-associated N-terminal domain-containing protein n=1 Tax=Fusobacterium simiae TaxID=855 RepID=A0ABT4DKJ8_FUSSI|nr:autotransporter-associated N-terminal domain-containing protein [Fusobacterium simiae]MCY7009131.1 autotransporter-associated N-terminal domain-containing protein [Fusobacterium simiae]